MKSVKEIDFDRLTRDRRYTPSPDAWEDQVLYFLMVDRFSDGKEKHLYNPARDFENALKNKTSAAEWNKAGGKWNGGTLKGVISKLKYLKGLGITSLWISPVLKQVAFEESYHGYGIQDFLAVDPHFGTADDLKMLASEVHKLKMYLVLDIVINHSGNVFGYEGGGKIYTGIRYNIAGFNDRTGKSVLSAEAKPDSYGPDDGIWPSELMSERTFTRKGQIRDWNKDPEYIEGDFFELKNIDSGTGGLDGFVPSGALKTLTACYKYWMAFADIDGFRLDTVKHVHPGAVKYFVREIHEFAKTIGKTNFYIIGEITGGLNFAMDMQNSTGIDAALGINSIPDKLENVAKGHTPASRFFDLFRNSDPEGSDEYKWYHNNVVSMFDDHDDVMQEHYKSRFCADKKTSQLLLNAVALNVLSPGIPCLYYGTEQSFDGSGDSDIYIREAMFGGAFGAFRSRGRHFFNTSAILYREIARLLEMRAEHICLRQGRTYLRDLLSGGGSGTERRTGRYRGLIAWSRIISDIEIVVVINCSLRKKFKALVGIDNSLHEDGDVFHCIYRSYSKPKQGGTAVRLKADRKCIQVEVPAYGCSVYTNRKSK